MLLKKASFRNFRSLASTQSDFGQITVLVGPNGAGKTNFVDALEFFRDVVFGNLTLAVNVRGGIGHLRSKNSESTSTVDVELELSGSSDPAPDIRYELRLASDDDGFRVAEESVHYLDKAPASSPPGSNSITPFDRLDNKLLLNGSPYGQALPSQTTALGALVELEELGAPIVRFARDWTFYSPFPDTLRDLKAPTRGDVLQEDAANWASVIRAMKTTGEGLAGLTRIAEAMRIVLPEYVEVDVSSLGGYLVPTFKLRGEAGAIQDFNAGQLSDGTLRIFAILLALHQPRTPELMVIEEPELMVHPGVLPMLAEELKEASGRMQIVLTTHSPQLVEQFAPEDVRVTWMSGAGTKIAHVKQSQLIAVKRKLMSLQEFMSAEGLLPDESAQ